MSPSSVSRSPRVPTTQRVLSLLRGAGTDEAASALYRGWARFALGFAMLLVAGGVAVDVATRAEMRRDQAKHLAMLHDANLVALRTWFDSREEFAMLWTTDEEVRAQIVRLVDGEAEASPEELRHAPELAAIRADLGRACAVAGCSGFDVLDRRGRILAASDDRRLGAYVELEARPLLAQALDGHAVATPPVTRVVDATHGPDLTEPIESAMFTASPVRAADERVVAVLVFRIPSRERLERLLQWDPSRQRPAETYAFDSRGVFLTEPRYVDELRARGVLGAADGARFRLEARAPPADLRDRRRSVGPWLSLPLARPVAEAVSGRSGSDVAGYRSYHGRMCIGSWSWLPEHRVGVVTEMELAEEMSALAVPRLGWMAAVAMVVLSAASALVSARLFSQVGKRLAAAESAGQYRLVAPIGEGGSSTVYLGRHRFLRRPTAVKVLSPQLVTAADRARFEREVQVTARLRHPNTVQVYDFGATKEGGFYYAMELVPGLALDQLVERFGPQADGRVANILAQVCGSLGEAHALGFVHRDVKPSNVRLADQGGVPDFVKVLDFGLAREFERGGSGSFSLAGMVGTPAFMPPEAFIDPKAFGPSGDLYSVGAVGYFLLTATPPSSVENVFRLMEAQRLVPVVPPSDRLGRRVDPVLEELLMRCLEFAADRRPSSARGLAASFAACPSRVSWTVGDARGWWDLHGGELSRARLDGWEGAEDGPAGPVPPAAGATAGENGAATTWSRVKSWFARR